MLYTCVYTCVHLMTLKLIYTPVVNKSVAITFSPHSNLQITTQRQGHKHKNVTIPYPLSILSQRLSVKAYLTTWPNIRVCWKRLFRDTDHRVTAIIVYFIIPAYSRTWHHLRISLSTFLCLPSPSDRPPRASLSPSSHGMAPIPQNTPHNIQLSRKSDQEQTNVQLAERTYTNYGAIYRWLNFLYTWPYNVIHVIQPSWLPNPIKVILY